MNILRLTRHEIIPKQVEELTRIFGNNLQVMMVNETIPDAGRVEELLNKHKADVLEAVLPLPLIADVLQRVKVPVIRSVMNRVVTDAGIEFTFDHYERIHRVVVETERL